MMLTIILAAAASTTACARRHHSVHFHTGPNGSNVAAQRVRAGSNLARPNANPTKDGYDFVNWYTHQSGGEVFNFERPINSNKTVYARWNKQANDRINNHSAIDRAVVDNRNNDLRQNTDQRLNDCRPCDYVTRNQRYNNQRVGDCRPCDYTARRRDMADKRNVQIGDDGVEAGYRGEYNRGDYRGGNYRRDNLNRRGDRARQPDGIGGLVDPNVRIPNPNPVPLTA